MGTASTRWVPIEGTPAMPCPEVFAGFVRWTYYPTGEMGRAWSRVTYTVARVVGGRAEVDVVAVARQSISSIISQTVILPASAFGGAP